MKKKLRSEILMLIMGFLLCATTLFAQEPGSALSFDGTTYVSTSAQSSIIQGDFTVMLWAKPINISKSAMHLFSTRESGEFGFDIQLKNGTTVHANIGNGSSFLNSTANATYSYKANEWMHIAYVVTPTTYTIYINGAVSGSGKFTGMPRLLDATHFIVLGKNAVENSYYEGSMDEVKVYNTSLSQANVRTEMARVGTSLPSNLVAYYNFNQGGNNLDDLSGNNYHGTIHNGNWIESYAAVIPGYVEESNISANNATLNWTTPELGEVDNGYKIEVSENSGFTSVIPGSPFATTDTFLNLNGLTSNTTYYYKIKSDKLSVTGQGAYSVTKTIHTSFAYDFLSALSMSNTILSADFSSRKKTYTGVVTAENIYLTVKQNHSGTTIQMRINGGSYNTITSGMPAAVNFNQTNNTLDILVTDGSSSRTYSFTLNRIYASTRYVTPTGAGTMDGSSWTNASNDLQLMIMNSSAHDMVWVAAGTYKPNRRIDNQGTISANHRDNAFLLKADVRIYGGFDGYETNLSQRKLTLHKSILSGDYNNNDNLTGEGAAIVLNNMAENAYHIVVSAGPVGNATLDGFTIRGGNANTTFRWVTVNGNDIASYSGGGIITEFSSPKLNNLYVTNNRSGSGSGMMNHNSSPVITNSVFHENTSVGPNNVDQLGGGIYNFENSSPTLFNVTISSNVGTAGVGMLNSYSSSPTLTNVVIKNNHTRGPRFYLDGAGMANSVNSSPILTNVLIYGNTAARDGGGIYNYDGSSPTLTNVTITNNRANQGSGGISFETSANAKIRNSIIWNNGTDLQIINSDPIFEHSIISGEVAGHNNINSDPLFMNADLNNFALQNGSPGINTGNNTYYNLGESTDISFITSDLNNMNRISDEIVDMGVFEKYIPESALNFDGVDDKITFPAPVSAIEGNYTVMAWVKPGHATKEMHLLSTNTSSNNGFEIRLKNGNIIQTSIGNGSAQLITNVDASFNYSSLRWMHIAYVITTTSYTLYVNGEQVLNGALAGSPLLLNGNHWLQIGNNNNENTFFSGNIDEVRIYKSALTLNDLQKEMFSQNNKHQNLFAYYDFDSGTPGGNNIVISTLNDQSILGSYNGTLNNFSLNGTSGNYIESYAMVIPEMKPLLAQNKNGFTASWSDPVIGIADQFILEVANDPAFTTPIAGSPFTVNAQLYSLSGLSEGVYYLRVYADKSSVSGQGTASKTQTVTLVTPPGKALNFDGVNDYVATSPKSTVVSNNFTVMAWVKPADATKAMHIFSTRESDDESFDIQLTGGNRIHGDIGNGNSWITTSASTNYNYAINQWLHIAYTVTPSGYTIYANGTQVGSGTFNANPYLMGPSHYITIGKNSTENTFFKGDMDEIKVYNTSLTQEQIRHDMVSDTSVLPSSLVAYYNFDQSENKLVDISGNGYTGSLNNFALSGSTSNWVESYAMVVPAINSPSNILSNRFTANWSAPDLGEVDHYILDVSTNINFSTAIIGSPFTVNGTSHTISGLSGETIYYYRVRANKTGLSGIAAFSGRGVALTTGPLPVKLISYTAKSDNNTALLEWSTASEINNKEFIISRSTDGKKFAELERVKGNNNSQEINHYKLYDHQPKRDINYYKLQQVDHNGELEELGIRAVNFNINNTTISYPNPAKSGFTSEWDPGKFHTIEITAIDGKIIKSITVSKDQSNEYFSLEDYPSGVYLIRFSGVNENQIQRIIKE